MWGSVSIHSLRNIAPRYRELSALLVYLTKHVFIPTCKWSRRGAVAEVLSFRSDIIFLTSTWNFFLDAHGRGQDAIVVFGKYRARKL